jgi:hypothetical protein
VPAFAGEFASEIDCVFDREFDLELGDQQNGEVDHTVEKLASPVAAVI